MKFFKDMKLRLTIAAIVLFAASACNQYTCPTYSKKDIKKEKQSAEVVSDKERS